MDDKLFRLIINQIAEEAIPAIEDPLPEITTKLLPPQMDGFRVRRPRLLLSQIIVVITLILSIFLLATPQGRALAQEIIHFFTRSNNEVIPLSPEQAIALSQILTPEPTYRMRLSTAVFGTSSPETEVEKIAAQLPGCSLQFRSYACQADAVKQRVGYDLKGFSPVPSGYVFSKFDFLSNNQGVMTIYKSLEQEGWLVLYQGIGNVVPELIRSSNWEKAPANKIETVKIGSELGEYVPGSFVVKAGSADMTWIDDDWLQRIGWQSGEHWFMIEENNNPAAQSYLNKEQLLAVARSLVELQNIPTPTLNFQYLKTMDEIEKAAGFPVLQPELLPEDFTFDFARYEPEWKSVILYYQGRSGILLIKQTKNEEYILRDLAKTYPNTRTYMVRNQPGIYASHEDNPKPVLWFEEGESVLFWRENDQAFQIIYRPNNYYGGEIGENELIAIGNSLK